MLALALFFIASWEVFWRLRGFTPRVNDDTSLWVLARDRASDGGREAVILVGSSRMQMAIDPDAFARATGWRRPLQLAIAMGPSLPVLRDLSDDPSVSGRVVCGIHPALAFDMTRQLDGVIANYLQRRSDFTPADVVETQLRIFTQRALVSSLPELFPRQLIRAWRGSQWPRPGHITFDAERFGGWDLRFMVGLEEWKRTRRIQWKNWKGRPASPVEVAGIVATVDAMVGRIRERGGDVIFVRLPTSGEVREWERRLFPRSRFWDVFAAKTDALSVHFEDHPQLRGFSLPDGSHLDQSGKREFSKALGEVIVRELRRRARGRPPSRPSRHEPW